MAKLRKRRGRRAARGAGAAGSRQNADSRQGRLRFAGGKSLRGAPRYGMRFSMAYAGGGHV